MRQDEQVSRYEVNRNVRMVITRHDADLTRIDYSFMGSTIYLNGDLVRPNGDFTAQEIENIAKELSALPRVRSNAFWKKDVPERYVCIVLIKARLPGDSTRK